MAPSRRFDSSPRLRGRLIDQWSVGADWVRDQNTVKAVGHLSSAHFPIEDAVGPAAFEHDTLPLPALGAGTETLWPHADSLYDLSDCLPEWPARPALSDHQVVQLTRRLLQGGFLQGENRNES